MPIFIRFFAWLLAAAVTFATLGPPGLRPHSDLGQDGEHALAFILVGLAFGLAYRNRRWAVAAVAVVLIGVLELMQFWAPGRHARLEDFWSMPAPPASAWRSPPSPIGSWRASAPVRP
ncbi:VanZ family protein [Bradyrhizobium barranii subsp. barranii]